jgi:hypothetical protein
MTFSIDLTRNSMTEVQEAMDYYHNELLSHAAAEAEKLGVTVDCMLDVLYLRSRSRWTQELEDNLIVLHQSGHRPNMCEFG